MSYIYHRVPENFQGDTLYPLNNLKSSHPGIYAAAIAKYDDRPYLLKVEVPPLNCLWNDVLFFIALHPTKYIEFIRSLGYGRRESSFFEIPTEYLIYEKTCVYFSEKRTYSKEDFFKYGIHQLSDFNYLPEVNKDYLMKQLVRPNQIFYPWKHVHHILYKGEINVSGLRVLSVGGGYPPEGVYTKFNTAIT